MKRLISKLAEELGDHSFVRWYAHCKLLEGELESAELQTCDGRAFTQPNGKLTVSSLIELDYHSSETTLKSIREVLVKSAPTV
ncbi:hypothetical protein OH492_06855 [Vibrio chagasii]|nr:hypothetical protein [Vibrio chagasii]